jgi:hypothetical protein
VHDSYISDALGSILTDNCMRKYSALEALFCFACHPTQSNFVKVQGNTTTITLCQSFVMSLWNVTKTDDLVNPTSLYDNCGFKVADSLKDLSDNKQYIIPSKVFKIIF